MNIKEALKLINKDETVLRDKAKKLLLKSKLTLTELADKLDVSPKVASAIVEKLSETSHDVKVEDDRIHISKIPEVGSRVKVDSTAFQVGEWHKFGLVSDTHLCSKYSRLDVLECLYDIYEREGITRVYHAGNMVDGECRFNKHDLVVSSGIDAQMEYWANVYPQRKGITTHYITGDDHEGWWAQREGVNVGKYMQASMTEKGRDDLYYLGNMESDIEFTAKSGHAWVKVMHPGGGSSYAFSYTAQKIVESFQGGEKPNAIFVGHYHKFDVCYPREVHAYQAGCVQDQTPFMRKKKIAAHVGGNIVEFHQAETGEFNRLRVEWMPFYDRQLYAKGERYKTW